MLVLRSKLFTKWDETDNLKRMKDSDILAEKEKQVPSYSSSVLPKAAAGAAIGAVGLGAANALHKGLGKGYTGLARQATGKTLTGWAAAGKGFKRGAIGGALAGAAIIGGMAAKKRAKEREDAQFYNQRLGYAQKQALRREKADWKQNMTQREGYSY